MADQAADRDIYF